MLTGIKQMNGNQKVASKGQSVGGWRASGIQSWLFIYVFGWEGRGWTLKEGELSAVFCGAELRHSLCLVISTPATATCVARARRQCLRPTSAPQAAARPPAPAATQSTASNNDRSSKHNL